MRITNDGNVVINNTTAYGKLSVTDLKLRIQILYCTTKT